jgi:ribosomal protein RSM22 (predicted rRNA methylase)
MTDEQPPRMLVLPDALREGIERALATTSTARWMREAQALSERYRAPRTADTTPLATGDAQVLGYLALLMPATYAQLRGAMAATAARAPEWTPASLLDLGSGPGTALWAAAAQWPSLRSLTAWEREPAFIAAGRTLARGSDVPALESARWERGDLRDLRGDERYDLVVLGHVLNELAPNVQRAVVAAAWERTAGVLLVVEPGTMAAFGATRAARDQLLAAGARTLAPCAHDRPCPLQDDWCHFPQRLLRPAFQRQARGAPSQWEDSKFSYAAMSRFGPSSPIWARVISEPTTNKAYAEVKLSKEEGTARVQGWKRHRDVFHRVRDLEWGEALHAPLPEPLHTIPDGPTTNDERPMTEVRHTLPDALAGEEERDGT